MKIHRGIEQGTEEWHSLRAGKPTASEADKIITSTGKPSAQRKAYLYKKAGERILGRVETGGYKNAIMQEGNDREAESRDVYAMEYGAEIEQVAFCTTDDGRYGCSPDGLIVGESCGWEAKNPLMHTHVGYLLSGVLPTDYKVQVHTSMLVTGYDRWVFWSYYPGLPPLRVAVESDHAFQRQIHAALIDFCEELDEATERLRGTL